MIRISLDSLLLNIFFIFHPQSPVSLAVMSRLSRLVVTSSATSSTIASSAIAREVSQARRLGARPGFRAKHSVTTYI